jgi:hypothetical protein
MCGVGLKNIDVIPAYGEKEKLMHLCMYRKLAGE